MINLTHKKKAKGRKKRHTGKHKETVGDWLFNTKTDKVFDKVYWG